MNASASGREKERVAANAKQAIAKPGAEVQMLQVHGPLQKISAC